MERLVVVSTDSHGGPAPADYGPYLDPQYRDSLALHLRDVEVIRQFLSEGITYPFRDEDLAYMDERHAIRSGGEEGARDPLRRLREVEAEGVCAEIVHPGTHPFGPAPFFEIMCAKYSPELRAAGARAHNRWLAEFCAAAPGRLIGSALIEPWPDMDAAVAELERARNAGLKVVWTDQFAGLEGEAPSLGHPYWDPFWAACVDLGIVVHIHVGFGSPQGLRYSLEFSKAAKEKNSRETHLPTRGDADPYMVGLTAGDRFDAMLFPSRRPLWQLIWGGVLDRYPETKVAFAEQHAYWIPQTLEYLDGVHARDAKSPMALTPSEYWRRNCSVACTSIRPTDLAVRDGIGVDRMTFGTDYPHPEGTWPNTLDWLRAAFVGVPEFEARKILGENAVEFYGLDPALLEGVASRVGPRPQYVLDGGDDVAPELISHFHVRSGYSKPSSFDEGELAAAVEEDVRSLAAASRGPSQ